MKKLYHRLDSWFASENSHYSPFCIFTIFAGRVALLFLVFVVTILSSGWSERFYFSKKAPPQVPCYSSQSTDKLQRTLSVLYCRGLSHQTPALKVSALATMLHVDSNESGQSGRGGASCSSAAASRAARRCSLAAVAVLARDRSAFNLGGGKLVLYFELCYMSY